MPGFAHGMHTCREIGGRILVARISHHQTVEADHAAFARIGHDLDLFLVARFETDGGRCGNVQVTAESGVTVELQITVDLEEMEMRTDLNRAVAGIAHDKLHGLAAGIVLDRSVHQDFSTDDDGLCGFEAGFIRIETRRLRLIFRRGGIFRIHTQDV